MRRLERVRDFVYRVIEPDGSSYVIELCTASQTWKVVSRYA